MQNYKINHNSPFIIHNYFVSLQKFATVRVVTIRLMGVVALLCSVLTSWAQDAGDGIRHAEQVFRWMLENEADSLYESMAKDMQQMVQRDQLKGAMTQAEAMAGPYQEHGEWTSQQADSLTVYASTVTFEHAIKEDFEYTIKFMISIFLF